MQFSSGDSFFAEGLLPANAPWRRTARFALAFCLVATLPLGGCDRTRSDMADAINGAIHERVCFSLKDMSGPEWPLRVQRGMDWMNEKPLHPILAAMQSAGYLQATQEKQVVGFAPPATIDVIMPTEDAKSWWDAKEGFCVGTKAVDEIEEWTEPGEGGPQPLQVSYTWKLADVPSWAKHASFQGIPGMAQPVEAMVVLQKTNKGYRAF